jgi:hypothetical protein
MSSEARPGQLVKMSTVAARNIALSLGVDEDKVEMIEQAITDEFQAIATHFTFMVTDIHQMRAIEERSKKIYLTAFLVTAVAFAVYVILKS